MSMFFISVGGAQTVSNDTERCLGADKFALVSFFFLIFTRKYCNMGMIIS